ncbi:HAD family hydrolase [Pseudomonas sp. NPDC090202]|uniref:HAD family hydrolase n=1 Tax=unclassified Pseudomonas TaxID=196821 RepID=UPI0037FE02CE
MNIAGVIFDCDGTLVDSERLAAGLLRDILQEHQVTLSLEEVLQRFRGVQFALCMEGLCRDYPWLPNIEIVNTFRARTLPLLQEHLEEMPGAVDFVRNLNLPKCVASNGPRNKIEACLSTVGLLDVFHGLIVSAYEVQAWKPSPILIEHAAELLGLKAEDCLLVEDSVPGVMAGLDAGAQVAGYGGDTDFSAFADHANFHRVRDFAELHALVQRIS